MNLAPIAVFVYRRPDHARQLLASALANPEAARSPFIVFSDGPRTAADAEAVSATRRVVREICPAGTTFVESTENLGLARSIIDGVTRVCEEYGRVVVLEDDLVVAPTFLGYVNAALERYAGADNVYSVCGFSYPVDFGAASDAVFLPFVSSWGWATWGRAWAAFDGGATGYAALRADRRLRHRFDLEGNYNFFDILVARMEGRNDSWAIRWYLSVFLRGGLSLFPARSLVENHGFGAGGTHCLGDVPRHARAVAAPLVVRAFPEPVLDSEAFRRVKRFIGRDFSLAAKARGALRGLARRLTR